MVVDSASTDPVDDLVLPPPIPDNGLLLHVGVFKTGTTALQEALRADQNKLRRADIHYRGPASWQWKPLLSLLAEDTPNGRWQQLEQGVREHSGRVLVSSENLCGSSPERAAEVVERLGGGRPVTVLITIRSLAGLLASTWQQFLKRGDVTISFEDWLHETFDAPLSPEVLFWRRNDYVAQVAKWGDLVGQQNVVLAVADKRYPTRNLRLVESLLGLPQGTVDLRPSTRSNRSMSYAEAEFLRGINIAIGGELTTEEYRRLVRLGTFPAMFRAESVDDTPIPVPRWAAEAASRIGSEQADGLRATQARIVGDIDSLADAKWDVDGPIPPCASVSLDTSIHAVVGTIQAAMKVAQEREAELTRRLTEPASRSRRLRLRKRP